MSATDQTAEAHTGADRYTVRVDGRAVTVDRPELAVVEIRALFGLDPEVDLIFEVEGGADLLLREDQAVALRPGRVTQLFSRPPTTFG